MRDEKKMEEVKRWVKEWLDTDIRKLQGLKKNASDEEVFLNLEKRINCKCKPCWEEDGNCPFGALVEEYPLIDLGREIVAEYVEMDRETLEAGAWSDGKPLSPKDRESLKSQVDSFKPEDFPEVHPALSEIRCEIFGHACPAYFQDQLKLMS